jgi:hypothetical protein
MDKTLKPERLEILIRDIRDICYTRGNPPWMALVDLCADLKLMGRWRMGWFSLSPYHLGNYLRQFNLEPEQRPDAAGISRGGYRFEVLDNLFSRYVEGSPRKVAVTEVKP